MTHDRQRIGLFSTVPIEVVYAAGLVPVDLNNAFVGAKDPAAQLRSADEAGLPRNICAWTRGLYAATVAGNIERLIVVPRGDCSNNVTMAELLERIGVDVVRFDYPLSQGNARLADVALAIDDLTAQLGTTPEAVTEQWRCMAPARALLGQVDRALWQGSLPASLARLLLLQATDFGGSVDEFTRQLEGHLSRAQPSAVPGGPRLAVFGIPSILGDLPEVVESLGGRIVLFETERDFAMVDPVDSMEAQYAQYAYPYGLEDRLSRFIALAREREVQGILINQQAFCHHNLELKRVEAGLDEWRTLVLESDAPGRVAGRDRVRLEGFVSLVSSDSRSTRPKDRTASDRRPSPAAVPCLGLDLGSRFAKVAYADVEGLAKRSFDSISFYRQFARREDGSLQLQLDLLLEALGIEPDRSPVVVATGYGRHVAALGNARVVPELEAHAVGALGQVDDRHFLLVDWGGQDTKVLAVNDDGLDRFVMNDKCAAGSGRYVENMARLLGEPLGAVLDSRGSPVALTNICATFGESEVIGHLVEGVPVADIAAGILASVAERTVALLARLDSPREWPLFLAGGLAASERLAEMMAERTGRRVEVLTEARYNGALGCCRIGQDPEAT